ncbi:MAG: bifunctional phosphopantothenoylcysteine decarboxylase/phosphopantothenate--cysteine ligase CoaBC [Alphaproteobacteria bacterium]
MLDGKRILLIITGGIAAYKSLDLIRRLRERGAGVRCVMTAGGAQFVTPLSVSALSHQPVYGDIFSLTQEAEMGHLRLSQEADLIVVAPATANFLAKMAHGIADDLASTVILAADRTVLAAPAMNTRMWENAATKANLETLKSRGVVTVGPGTGALAEDESGIGRMAEVIEIVAAIEAHFGVSSPLAGPLAGHRALVTSGPTYEAIDPVRYIANRSSGKQGHAIAIALARLGAATTLVSGPSAEPDPPGLTVVHIESAAEMLEACLAALPADVAVCAAAVGDWRIEGVAGQKIKKNSRGAPKLALVENPDILKTLAAPGNRRPRLVVGFAAETQDIEKNARAKLKSKGCDWILANDVAPGTGTFGGDENTLHLFTAKEAERWPTGSKAELAGRLAARIAEHLAAGA